MHRNNRHCELRGVWSVTEHERFIEAIAAYPCGPWRLIADHVGTRSIKQVQTHAQKYQQKLMRHQRGLIKRKTKLKKPEHRVDELTLDQFQVSTIVRHAKRRVRETQAKAAARTDSPSSCSGDFPIVDDDDWMLAMSSDLPTDIDLMDLVPEPMINHHPYQQQSKGQADDDEDDDVVPDFHAMYDSPMGWNEWQLDDLLQPPVVNTTLEADKGAPLDGSELPVAVFYV